MLKFDEYQKANADLQEKLAEREATIKALEEKLRQADKNYSTLKTARLLEVSDGDMEAAKAKLSKLIRSVNQCITLLSEK